MIYHLFAHASVYADVFTSDEPRLFRAEKEHHVGNVHRIAHTPCWLLCGICTFIDSISCVNPAGRNAIDPRFACKTYRQGMSECRYSTLCCGVTFSLWLAHSVTR